MGGGYGGHLCASHDVCLADRAVAALAQPVVDAAAMEHVQARQPTAGVPRLKVAKADGAAAKGRVRRLGSAGSAIAVSGRRRRRRVVEGEAVGLDHVLGDPAANAATATCRAATQASQPLWTETVNIAARASARVGGSAALTCRCAL